MWMGNLIKKRISEQKIDLRLEEIFVIDNMPSLHQTLNMGIIIN